MNNQTEIARLKTVILDHQLLLKDWGLFASELSKILGCAAVTNDLIDAVYKLKAENESLSAALKSVPDLTKAGHPLG